MKNSLCWLLLLLPVALFAQETTGGIQGIVKDPSGAAIPDASVEVSGPSLIGKKTALSNSVGRYRVDQLPPGIYSITVSATGFAQQTQTNLAVTTGALPTVDFAMLLGAVATVVEVTDQAGLIDVSLSKIQTKVTQDILLAIPKGRSFQSVIPFAPGARQEPLQGARESRLNGFQIDGATDSENVYLIDGVNATDIGIGGVGKDFQSDFVQEVQIKSGGFEAEFGGALGGVINAIPKRGSNSWHGELKGYFQSANLNATDPCGSGFTASLNPQFLRAFSIPSGYSGVTCGLRIDPTTALNTTTRLDGIPEFYIPKKDSRHIVEPGYELGGAIWRDKLWAYSSYIPTLDSIRRDVNFKCPSSNPSCTSSGPRRFGQTMVQHNAYNRLDLGLTNALRFYGSWNYAYTRTTGQLPAPDSKAGQVNTGATIDPTTLRSDQSVVSPLSLFSFGGDWTPTSKLLITSRYGYFFKNFSTRGTPTGIRYVYENALNAASRDLNNNPFPANSFFNNTGFSNIPANFAFLFDAFYRKTFDVDASYVTSGLGGVHNIKFGYFWQGQGNSVERTANTSEVRFFWGLQYQPVTSTAACDAIRATSNGLCQGQYGYFHVGSTTVSNTGSSHATANALYVQDSWTVGNSGLTLNLGVRLDEETIPPFDPKRFPEVHFGWGDKIAPRLGGAYDVLHNGSLKVFASYGKFFDITKMDLPRSVFGSDYWHQCVYALDTVNIFSITPTLTTGAGCPPTGPAPGVTGRFIENADFRAAKADPRDPAVQPDMKSVSSHDVMAGVEWAINPRLVFEGRYSHKRLDQTIEDMSINDTLGFYIGNPGSGYADVLHRPVVIPVGGVDTLIATPFCAECPAAVKPIRKYDALELRLTHRGAGKYFITGSYTYEKLRGNYSGLTDTDPTDANGGRHNPNHGRPFDIPTMTYLPTGKIDEGPLASSRPHTAKIFGSYDVNWFGQVTRFGLSQLLYQGTPMSSCLPVIIGAPSACQWAEGRGNFALLSREANGNIVKNGVKENARTEPLYQTDLSVRHEIHVSKDNDNYKFVIEGNAYNLFNQHSETSHYLFVIPTNAINPRRTPRFAGDPGTDFGKVMNGYNYVDALNGTGAFGGGVQTPLTLAGRYGLPQTFQIARQFRFAVRFMF